MTIRRVTDYAVIIESGRGCSTVTFAETGSRISINISGPRGGNQQATIVDRDDLYRAVDAMGLSTHAIINAFDDEIRSLHAVLADTKKARDEARRDLAEAAVILGEIGEDFLVLCPESLDSATCDERSCNSGDCAILRARTIAAKYPEAP